MVTQFEHNILNEPEVFIYRLDSVLLRKKVLLGSARWSCDVSAAPYNVLTLNCSNTIQTQSLARSAKYSTKCALFLPQNYSPLLR